MPYRFLADAVVLLHTAFVVFVVCGGLLVLWRRWMAFVHLPAAVWGVYIEFSGRICPLTPLENHLRAMAGDAGYSGDFVDRYLMPVLYPPGLRRDVQIGLRHARIINSRGYNTVVWRQDQTVYSLVSDSAEEDLIRMVRASTPEP